MNRRDLIKKGIIMSCAFSASSVLFSCKKKDDDDVIATEGVEIDLNAPAYLSLKTEGNFLYYRNIIIINTGDEFVALSRICTHEGCEVGYVHAVERLHCPCHDSVFSTSGSVITGPAEVALRVYTVTREEDILIIK